MVDDTKASIQQMKQDVTALIKKEEGMYASELYWHNGFSDYETTRRLILANLKQGREQEHKR